jgi:hypothetical protein
MKILDSEQSTKQRQRKHILCLVFMPNGAAHKIMRFFACLRQLKENRLQSDYKATVQFLQKPAQFLRVLAEVN